MKKSLIRIGLGIAGILLLVVFLLPVLFKPKVETMVREQFSEFSDAEISWTRLQFSMIQSFPKASVRIENVFIQNQSSPRNKAHTIDKIDIRFLLLKRSNFHVILSENENHINAFINVLPDSNSVYFRTKDVILEGSRIESEGSIDFSRERSFGLDLEYILVESNRNDSLEIDFLAEDVKGTVRLMNGIAIIDNMAMNIFRGTGTVRGSVDLRVNNPLADVWIMIREMDIQSSFLQSQMVRQLFPVAQNAHGIADLDLKGRISIDSSLNADYNSMQMEGIFRSEYIKAVEAPNLERLAVMVKNSKMKNLEIENIRVDFSMKASRIYVHPFSIPFESSNISVSGSHGIDQSLDYRIEMDIAQKDLRGGASFLISSLSKLNLPTPFSIQKSDRLKVNTSISGTFEKPLIRME